MGEPEDQPFSPLVGDVITAMFTQSHHTTNLLVDGLTRQAETAEATLAAVRCEVTDLLTRDYMPTPAAIERALWPSDKVVDSFRPGVQ